MCGSGNEVSSQSRNADFCNSAQQRCSEEHTTTRGSERWKHAKPHTHATARISRSQATFARGEPQQIMEGCDGNTRSYWTWSVVGARKGTNPTRKLGSKRACEQVIVFEAHQEDLVLSNAERDSTKGFQMINAFLDKMT